MPVREIGVYILVCEGCLSDCVSWITRLTIMPPKEWQMKMIGLSEAPSIWGQQGKLLQRLLSHRGIRKWQFAYTTIRFELRHQCMCMLQDSIGRCASQQRRHVRIIAPGEDPGVTDDFGEHLLVAEPGRLRILRRPCLECVAVEAVDGDDAVGLVVSAAAHQQRFGQQKSYSTTGSLLE